MPKAPLQFCSSKAGNCQYKHKKDTAGGKKNQTTALDATGQARSCDRNSDWKITCKDGNGDTDEVDCKYFESLMTPALIV
jgi:hypothetical protein